MAVMKNVQLSRIFMGKLRHGADLLDEITEFCERREILLGRIEGLGAVQKARIGYYKQETHEYEYINLDRHYEITMLIGNVSIKDNIPFVHAHLTLADEQGNCIGGHLAPGTIIFACELVVQAFEGPLFQRGFDVETGLPLWEIRE